ncbi:MAG: hypothetical protein P8Q53_09515 [Flavobacteriaceae bacterium]|nr:hypothetical protein [Flavobacteriaceae bacterium]
MKNLKILLLFIPFIASSQARDISNISPLGKLTAALDMGTDSKYYIRYLDTKMKMMEYTRFLKIGNKKKLKNFKKNLLEVIQYKIKDKKIFLNKNTIILNSSGKKRIFITIIDENNITSGIKWLSIKQINVLIPAAEL